MYRDLETMADTDRIEGTFYGVAWSYDSSVLFYNTQSALGQGLQVWRHTRGASTEEDTLVYNEADASFEVHVTATNDGECAYPLCCYLLCYRSSSLSHYDGCFSSLMSPYAVVLVNLFGLVTTEVWYLPTRDPYANLTLFYPRTPGGKLYSSVVILLLSLYCSLNPHIISHIASPPQCRTMWTTSRAPSSS